MPNYGNELFSFIKSRCYGHNITSDITITINKLEITVHKLYVKRKPLKINYNISYDYTV